MITEKDIRRLAKDDSAKAGRIIWETLPRPGVVIKRYCWEFPECGFVWRANTLIQEFAENHNRVGPFVENETIRGFVVEFYHGSYFVPCWTLSGVLQAKIAAVVSQSEPSIR